MKSFARFAYPYGIWMLIFIVAPVLMIAFYAFTTEGNDVITVKFTFDNFIRFVSDEVFTDVLLRSLNLAIITTVICILIGYPAAYAIARTSSKAQIWLLLSITLPMWINMLVRTYAWRGILLNFDFSSDINVLIGMVYNFLPFMIIQIYTALSKMDKSLFEAAADLGADSKATFLKVILPLSLPGVISGITLVFLPAVSTFFIPKLLGGGEYFLIGNLIESYFVAAGEWNFGSAISLIMAVIIIFMMYLAKKVDVQKEDS